MRAIDFIRNVWNLFTWQEQKKKKKNNNGDTVILRARFEKEKKTVVTVSVAGIGLKRLSKIQQVVLLLFPMTFLT